LTDVAAKCVLVLLINVRTELKEGRKEGMNEMEGGRWVVNVMCLGMNVNKKYI
jgi:hypothetical protein